MSIIDRITSLFKKSSKSVKAADYEVLWNRSASSSSWIETIDRIGRVVYHPVVFKSAPDLASKIEAVRSIRFKTGYRLWSVVIDNRQITL